MWLRHIVALVVCMVVGVVGVAGAVARQADPAQIAFEAARKKEVVDRDLPGAIVLYREVVSKYASNRVVAADSLLRLGECYEQLGQPEATATYERVIKDYPDSAPAGVARAKLAAAAQKDSGPTARRVWDQYGDAVSPDGEYLTFTDWETGDLAVHDVASGRDRRLTNNGKWNDNYAEGPLPSPDGRLIAYGWYNIDEDGYELRVIGRDGGEPRVLRSIEQQGDWIKPIGWTPDGKGILCLLAKRPVSWSSAASNPKDLLSIPAAGGAPRLIKTFGQGVGNCVISPDGRSATCDTPAGPAEPGRDIFSVSLDSGREMPIIRHAADDYMLGWFPDGGRILFASDRGGTYGIWMAAIVDGRAQGEPSLIRPDTGAVDNAGFTRRGDFYYGSVDQQDDVYLAALDPDTGKQTGRLTRLEGRFIGGKMQAAWSPDGQRIAYVQAPPPAGALRGTGSNVDKKLAIQTISTGEVQLLSLALRNMGNPAWLPDGRGVIVQGLDLQDQQGLFLLNVDTGALTTVGDSQEPAETRLQLPAVSPDGRQVFFRRRTLVRTQSSPQSSIVVRDLASGVERVVTTDAVRDFALSPDGRWIAWTGSPAGGPDRYGFVTPSSGGEPRALPAIVSGSTLPAIAWRRDGRSVFVVKLTDGGEPQIWQVPIDGTAPRDTGIRWSRGTPIARIDAHPDGRQLAISTQTTSSETWVLQNLPPARGK